MVEMDHSPVITGVMSAADRSAPLISNSDGGIWKEKEEKMENVLARVFEHVHSM